MELAWEFGYQPRRRNELEPLTWGNRRTADSREDQEQGEDGQNIEADFCARGSPNVLPTGGVPEGNPVGKSGCGISPWRAFTAAAASAARAASCPPRSSEVSNKGG
jgi:hypothetical protein